MYQIMFKARNLAFWFMALLSLSLYAQAPKASDEDLEFVEARRLFWSGQYKESEAQLKHYLSEHPKHEATQSFLQMIEQSRRYDPAKIEKTYERLEKMKIHKVELKNAEWRAVSSYLQDLANNPKNENLPQDPIHFINMLPTGFSRKISLNLHDVPLMEVIEEACKQADLRFVVDTWAVIIDLPQPKK